MDNKEDNELVRELLERVMKYADEFAFERLYKLYEPLILNMQKKFYLKGFTDDDWKQYSRIVFYKAVMTYDLDSGVTLGKYFKVILERAVLDQIRRDEAQKRRIDRDTISLEGVESQVLEVKDYYNSNVEDRICAKESLEEYLTILTPFELQVVGLYANNVSVKEIALQLDCSQQKIYRVIKIAKQKLRNIFIE